ncbi:MAG: diacylglycerol kinase family protein [Eubacteriales bacterium]|jgi:diacylglycerol kinase (ATP)|nr:diacylglycerol kinase family protein [Eubacteriales bacterium]
MNKVNKVHLLNPVAGKGKAAQFLKKSDESDDIVYETQSKGDGERFVYETLISNPGTHIFVYGGDGTVYEAVNGIMRAGAENSALLTVIPTGSGNDFIRNFKDRTGTFKVDLIKYNDRYAVNMINMGFDCNVVENTERYKKKPLVTGSGAYIMAVAYVLFRRMGERFIITLTDKDGEETVYDGEFLLTAIANGQFYGGGFRAASLAVLDDGLLDVMVINKVSRPKFISLIGDYQKGLHMNPITGKPVDKFRDFISFGKYRRVNIKNITKVCVDGEVEYIDELDISVAEQAISVFV